MSQTAPLKNVILAGASGSLGSAILTALLAQPSTFTVTILTRASSKSTFPDNLRVLAVPDDYPVSALATAFAGQDAAVNAIRAPFGQADAIDARFAEAAATAGVSRLITNHFTADLLHEGARQFIPLYEARGAALEAFAKRFERGEFPGLTWTAMFTGGWIDWGIEHEFFGAALDTKNQRAVVYDSGTNKFSGTTLPHVGLAVARVLERPAQTADRVVYTQTLVTTHLELIAACERATGKKWEIEQVDGKSAAAEASKRAAEGDALGMYALVGIAILGDVKPSTGMWFEESRKLDNDVLGGLPTADLDEVVRNALKL